MVDSRGCEGDEPSDKGRQSTDGEDTPDAERLNPNDGDPERHDDQHECDGNQFRTLGTGRPSAARSPHSKQPSAYHDESGQRKNLHGERSGDAGTGISHACKEQEKTKK